MIKKSAKIASAFLISIAVVGTAQAERLRMYTDRTAQENVIAGPVRVIDTTNQTGSIELDGEAIKKWTFPVYRQTQPAWQQAIFGTTTAQ